MGHSPLAVYVSFQGTKHARDWGANLSFRHAKMWQGDREEVRSERRKKELCTRSQPCVHVLLKPCRAH